MIAGQLVAPDPNSVKPGWIAFFVVLALAIGTFLLWRNMNKQLRKIKVPHAAEFTEPGRGSAPSASGPPATPQPQPEDPSDPPPATS